MDRPLLRQWLSAGLRVGKETEMAASQEKDAQHFRYNNRRGERMPGMSLLLDAYALVDCGVAESIALQKELPACGPCLGQNGLIKPTQADRQTTPAQTRQPAQAGQTSLDRLLRLRAFATFGWSGF